MQSNPSNGLQRPLKPPAALPVLKASAASVRAAQRHSGVSRRSSPASGPVSHSRREVQCRAADGGSILSGRAKRKRPSILSWQAADSGAARARVLDACAHLSLRAALQSLAPLLSASCSSLLCPVSTHRSTQHAHPQVTRLVPQGCADTRTACFVLAGSVLYSPLIFALLLIIRSPSSESQQVQTEAAVRRAVEQVRAPPPSVPEPAQIQCAKDQCTANTQRTPVRPYATCIRISTA